MPNAAPNMVKELVIKYVPTEVEKGPAVTGADDVAQVLIDLLEDEPSEVFGVLLLDSQNQILAWHEATRGILDAALVHPREVFRAAILGNAAGIIVAHNHPSGNPNPSDEDRTVTRNLVRAGAVVGIPVLDHVIIGDGGRFTSFAGSGLMPSTHN